MPRRAVVLRLVSDGDDLSPVFALMTEFLDWAHETALREHGIDLKPTDARDLMSDLSDLRHPRARLYLAEICGEPVGMGGLKPINSREAEIKRMYVRPSARGRGVGGALLGRLIDDARSLGYGLIRLESGSFMSDAHALYTRFGFEPDSAYAGREFGSTAAVDRIQVFMALDLTRP